MLEGKIGKIYFARLFEGEDLYEATRSSAEKSGVKAGVFLLIGTLKHAVLGYYKAGQYKNICLDGPLEIASCIGNVAVDEKGEVIVHAHLVVSDENGKAFGGHLMKDSLVGATAELVLIEGAGVNLQRVLDKKTNLKLLNLR